MRPMPTALTRRLVPSLLVFAYLMCAVAVAAAWSQASDTPPVATETGILDEVYRAIIAGRWSWLAGLGLIAVIEPAKRWLLGRGWLRSDLGGLVLAFAAAAVTGAASALLAGELWTTATVTGILRNAVVAIGGYTAIKRVILERFAAGAKVATSLPPAPAREVADAAAVDAVAVRP